MAGTGSSRFAAIRCRSASGMSDPVSSRRQKENAEEDDGKEREERTQLIEERAREDRNGQVVLSLV